jgi:caffeoyl-CoA O-methyltransferase
MSITLVPADIEDYAQLHSDPEPELLRELREETQRVSTEARMLVGRLEGAFLKMLVHLTNAQRVLEIGTFTGYSALWMAEALPPDGTLVTCDIDEKTTAVAHRYFGRSPYGRKIEVRLGRALETLSVLPGPFDLVFIDADKENYTAYYEAVLPKLRTGGLIVADNTLWSGRVLTPQSASDHGLVTFNAHVAKDARVERVLLTVRDGLVIARKR